MNAFYERLEKEFDKQMRERLGDMAFVKKQDIETLKTGIKMLSQKIDELKEGRARLLNEVGGLRSENHALKHALKEQNKELRESLEFATGAGLYRTCDRGFRRSCLIQKALKKAGAKSHE